MKIKAPKMLITVVSIAASVALLAGCSSSGAGGASTKLPAGADAAVYKLVPDSIKKAGSFTLATDAEWPPCEFYEKGDTKTMVGFEPELWNAIGKKMGVTVKASSIPFDNMVPGVVAGRYDASMECLTDNTDREKQVDFVDMFYSTIGTLVPKDNPHGVGADPLSLCGLKIGTQSGSDLAGYVKTILAPACTKANKPFASAQEFGSQAQVFLALDSQRIDVTLYSVSQAAYLIQKQGGKYAIFANSSLPKSYSGPVFAKGSAKLRDAWLAATEAIIKDGQYGTIMKKWGVELNNMDKPGVNLAVTRPL